MNGLSARQAHCVATISVASLWLATTAVSGRREAWGPSLYWAVAYPLAIAIAGALGYLAPDRPWRWALALMLVQALVVALASARGRPPSASFDRVG